MVRPRSAMREFSDDIQAAVLEFIGTTFFLLFALGGTQAAFAEMATTTSTTSDVTVVLYISLCFGLSLLMAAWLFFRVTGGLFNPNVSLALLLCGIITPVRFVLYCIAQLLGGIAAAGLVLALTPGPLASNTTLAPGVNVAQGMFIEMFITAALVLSVLMLAAEKSAVTPFAPVGVGLTLFAGELFSVFYTGGAANTARAFGPAVVTGFPHGNHWIYWVGPLLGSILATAFYQLLRLYQYWTLNPGQDSTDPRESPSTVLEQKLSPSNRRTGVSEAEADGAGVGGAGAGGIGRAPNDSAV